MRNIHVETIQKPMHDVEFVERKGLGHPDTICDALGEEVSKALCLEYINRFGAILHHNADKITLVAGMSSPKFGAGEVISPIYIMLAGRATQNVGSELFPVQEIAIQACNDYLEKNLFALDVSTNVDLDSKLGQGSTDLQSVFERKKTAMPLCNDTSFGIGYAPLNELESLVYDVEQFLTAEGYRKKNPFIGEDVKVMGLRKSDGYVITVADAFIGRYLSDLNDYKEMKQKTIDELNEFIKRESESPVDLIFNNCDDYANESVYLTVTGLSAENGDDGAIGRGNRINGLITPNRPMSLEAVAGKNPVNHTGKIYNILAHRTAEQIVDELSVSEAYVKILSGIGMRIDEPMAASVQLVGAGNEEEKAAFDILDYNLQEIQALTRLFVDGKIKTF
ncbi:methionine adenosyltransferase [Candidatus Micrarchaeota archaeon]|nr:methionine adenosyltransferase [Candidatus Micrarchaeota archaeon]